MTASTTRRETGTSQLLAEVTGGVALVTFNNPEKRNAMSVEMRRALAGPCRPTRRSAL
jgi:enoyl-CoA hydratase/carnithine racemase